MENIDYTLEAGATRLFEAEKLARQMQEQEQKQLEEDELNPMKVVISPYWLLYKPQCEKTGVRGFRPGLTQTDLYSQRSRLEA